jgi:Zn-finger nucleic acid-binding protein
MSAYRGERPLTCPRCGEDTALSEQVLHDVRRHLCAGCGGVWIAEDQLQLLFVALGLGIGAHEPFGPLAMMAGGARCPICRAPMTLERTYGDELPAEIDVCAAHGAWFDRDELAHALAQLQLEAMDRVRDPLDHRPSEVALFTWLHRRFVPYEPRLPTRVRGAPDEP